MHLQLRIQILKIILGEELTTLFSHASFLKKNDFLPNIPSLEIKGALDLLLSLYKEFVNSSEYLTESCKPNLKNLEKFMQSICSYKDNTFNQDQWHIKLN